MQKLVAAATAARTNAYSPYSGFSVGAALQTVDGQNFTGCNIENISFGLTMCAERVAIGAALASGPKCFSAIAIVSDSLKPVMPCGACRQVLAEFNPSMMIFSATLDGHEIQFGLEALLPYPRQGILESST